MLSPRPWSPMMLVALVPQVYMLSTYMTEDNVLNALILAMFWAIWMIIVCAPFYLVVGKYILLSMYLPMVLVFSRRPGMSSPSSLWLFLETWFWDKPLLIWVRLIAMTGSRALHPFMNVIVENRSKLEANGSEKNHNFLIIGSIPLARDVATIMAKSPYNVGCVVNMCREYAGPESEYIRHGIQQFHAKTPDLCEPVYSDMIDCVSFLRLYRNNVKNANKRALIHCKGGRSRSACIALCYLLSTGIYTVDEAFKTIKASRTVADRGIKQMNVVKRFVKELEDCGGSFDRLQLRYVSKGLGSDSQGQSGLNNRIAASLRTSRASYRPSPPSSPSHSNSPGAGARRRSVQEQKSSPLLRK